MDLFSLSTTTDYTFLELQSGAGGNQIVSETAATGVIKYRDGMVQEQRGEAHTSQSTLHIRPDEAFISRVGGHLQLVGHGIRAGGDEYRIEGIKVGMDYEKGVVAFYLATLKKESVWDAQASPLPLV